MATVPPADDYERAREHERVDVAILRALGQRRAHRTLRTRRPTSSWDRLECLVTLAATVLWEMPTLRRCLAEDLLAYCAFLARELEVTESLDLDFDPELERLQSLAPRAIAALDDVCEGLQPTVSTEERMVAGAFSAIRRELETAARLAWASAA